MASGIQSGDVHRSLIQTIDWQLIIYYLLIVFFGWMNIYAAVRSFEPDSILDFSCNCGKQFIWMMTALGLAVLILFAISPRIWEVLSTPGYMVVCVLLVAVIFLSKDVKGSHSWFELGPIKFQPAELSKITTSLLLAAVMSRPNFKLSIPKCFMVAALIIGIPMLTIIAESETGSALVYVGFLFVLYREGFSGWWLFFVGMVILLFILTLTVGWKISAGVVVAACLTYLIWRLREKKITKKEKGAAVRLSLLGLAAGAAMIFATNFIFENVLQDHQRARIEVLLGLKEDIRGAGYNVHQSMIAIGSGGLTGKGYLNGTQTTYGFVPEQSTDFIFCTVGEEWGFLGCLGVIALYVLMISRILNDAEEAREGFTRIYGYCLAACLSMHLFINVGMTIGLMPVIGIPLPYFSYGGSSLWAFTVMLFIFIALNKQEKKYF